jgi:uncharacterized protein with PQ loop repeat
MAMTISEVAGLAGAAISVYAYLPQITHLVSERCSAGVSERAFRLWLLASLLMTYHALTIGAVVFVVLGLLQVGSTAVIASYGRRYRGMACPSHMVEPSLDTLAPLNPWAERQPRSTARPPAGPAAAR